jgi:polyisoprenoid-binding protein YceI
MKSARNQKEANSMNKFRLLVGVLAVIAVVSTGAFLYLTREIAAPSQSVQAVAQQLAADNSGSNIVFRISQDESEAEYNIGEVLNGSDKLVVGTTNQVAGDILVNLSNPSASEVGEIRINARTFATDESRRDNTVARFVLRSEDSANEIIVFQPTSLSGLPTSVKVGDTLQFKVTGKLTIAGVTKEVTFDVTETLESPDQLKGEAKTTISRSDFNLTIPQVPMVANVQEQVTLKLDFVAHKVNDVATNKG